MSSYNYKVIFHSDEDQSNRSVPCKTAGHAAKIINDHFGFPVTSQDSVYNYFTRRHLSNKKVFGSATIQPLVELERTKKPKPQQRKSKPRATTEAQCSSEISCP